MELLESWFVANQDLIDFFTSMASILSMLLAFIALLFTAAQIRNNTREIRAKTIYDIQKDGRETARMMLADNHIAEEIIGKEIDLDLKVGAMIGQLFNFYSSVFYQKQMGTLDKENWKLFEEEIRVLLNSEKARSFWHRKREQKQYSIQFTELMDKLEAELPQKNKSNE